MSDTRHVAGAMKQSNKAHKSRFRSKGQLADGSRGRVNSTSSLSGASVASSGASSRRSGNTLGREARREQAKQVRSNKRAAVALQKRALGQGASPPHVVVVAALQQPADAAEVAALLLRACSETKPQGNVKVRRRRRPGRALLPLHALGLGSGFGVSSNPALRPELGLPGCPGSPRSAKRAHARRWLARWR